MSIIQSMQARRAAAPAEYAALLDPTREPQPGDAERMTALMTILGLSTKQVTKHAQARERAHAIDREKVEADLAEKQKKLHELFEKIDKHREQTKLIRNRRDDEERVLKMELFALKTRVIKELQDQLDDLQQLQRENPLAFGLDLEASSAGDDKSEQSP